MSEQFPKQVLLSALEVEDKDIDAFTNGSFLTIPSSIRKDKSMVEVEDPFACLI